ncbi:MAG: pyridoxine 5'-phosphate synthase, partial [Cyclobacteriaceae bacterium]|nr:pyridoxine 5'-phosphate synthase [Cyclobacteriaceae bacterium]
RGGNNPDMVQVVKDIESFGAQGITVHPRPDERHITREDVYAIKEIVSTEFNIEGYPDRRFMDLIREIRPDQATLVPDSPDVITSNAGWNTLKHSDFLKEVIGEIKGWGVRTSIFIETDITMIEGAAAINTDRVELYTEAFAKNFTTDPEKAVHPYVLAAKAAIDAGLGLNAGHDLDLKNLHYFAKNIPGLNEVSIGHALVCDALYYGLENTIGMYLRALGK